MLNKPTSKLLPVTAFAAQFFSGSKTLLPLCLQAQKEMEDAMNFDRGIHFVTKKFRGKKIL
jgi:hypothetical protein